MAICLFIFILSGSEAKNDRIEKILLHPSFPSSPLPSLAVNIPVNILDLIRIPSAGR